MAEEQKTTKKGLEVILTQTQIKVGKSGKILVQEGERYIHAIIRYSGVVRTPLFIIDGKTHHYCENEEIEPTNNNKNIVNLMKKKMYDFFRAARPCCKNASKMASRAAD